MRRKRKAELESKARQVEEALLGHTCANCTHGRVTYQFSGRTVVAVAYTRIRSRQDLPEHIVCDLISEPVLRRPGPYECCASWAPAPASGSIESAP